MITVHMACSPSIVKVSGTKRLASCCAVRARPAVPSLPGRFLAVGRGARIQTDKATTTLIFEDKVVPAFAQFVSAKLDELYREFEDRQKEEKDQTTGR